MLWGADQLIKQTSDLVEFLRGHEVLTLSPGSGLVALATLSYKGKGYQSERLGRYTRIGIST